MNQLQLKQALENFLNEDIGRGDRTSESIFAATDTSSGEFLLKDTGVVCGLFIAPIVYDLLGGGVTFTPLVPEGSFQEKGTVLARVEGPIRTLLTGERLILNLWQRMGGIASATRKAIALLNDDTIRLCDTRKTLPGLRMFDKYAVTQGGGFNHRMGLDDGMMLKDNHIAFAGSLTQAVEKVHAVNGHMIKVEVEIETLAQFQEALVAGADVIMLDNRTPEEIREYLVFNNGTITEASGGITLTNIADFKGCGVDYISLGALTHSVTALDISFNSLEGVKAQ